MPIENAAELLIETVDSLSRRAPGIIASAAHQLGNIVVWVSILEMAVTENSAPNKAV